MLVGRKKKHILSAAVSVVAAVCLFTSCASTPSEGDSASAANPETPGDAALLLDNSSTPATDVSDAGAFADLEAGKDKPAAATDPEPKADSSGKPADDGAPYYNSVGGESLRRVAHTLYSDKSFAAKLLDKNPELKGVKHLSAEQKVYFDMDVAKPEPTYLTKDLLDRYPGQLAERLTASVSEKGISKTTVTLNRGETLQELSKRLYGTHRYWTEIFLVNHDKIQNYDKVKSGITLTVFERPNSGVAAAEPVNTPVAAKVAPVTPSPVMEEPTPAPIPVVEAEPVAVTPTPVAMPTQPEPVQATQPEPVAVTPADPIPETPPAPAPVAVQPIPETKLEPAPVAELPKTAPEPAQAVASQPEISSSNAVTRPIIYAVLVLLILGGGFYYTRTPKKPKVDMLDITAAESGGRPKLSAKDSQNKIG